MKNRFQRLTETDREPITLRIDGVQVTALSGDTLMAAILTHQDALRTNEFDHEHRAGFCLMGACQDCWVWTRKGERLRSCSTYVQADMDIVTKQPEEVWNVHELSL